MANSTCTLAWRFLKGLKTLREYAIHNTPVDLTILSAAREILCGRNDAGDGFMHSVGIGLQQVQPQQTEEDDEYENDTDNYLTFKICMDSQGSGMPIDGETLLKNVAAFGIYITVIIKTPLAPATQRANAFTILMGATRALKYPPTSTRNDQRSRQMNGIVDILKAEEAGFSDSSIASGKHFHQVLAELLWKLDPHRQSRNFGFPTLFAKLQGMNDPKAHKHKAEPLSQADLVDKLGSLVNALDAHWMGGAKFTNVKIAVSDLCGILKKIISSLQADVERKRDQDAVSTSGCFGLLDLPDKPLSHPLPESVAKVCAVMELKADYEVVELNEILPRNRHDRHTCLSFMKKYGIQMASTLYSCTHRSQVENLHFLWKLPAEATIQDQTETIARVREKVPIYHNRYVRREFRRAADKLNIQAKYSRYLYRLATSDASAPETSAEKEVDSRIMRFVELGDEDVVLDLRKITREGKSVFDEFFDIARRFIDGAVGEAVDDRRHDAITHLAKAMSAADLYRSIKEQCGPTVSIPSLAWFCMSFAPPNKRHNSRFTGKLKVKRMIQRRQLHSDHPDAHYGSAVFRYLKEMAMKYRADVNLVCCDDKCKIDVGEPDYPIAAVSRGKQVIVGLNEVFTVGDHDFSRTSLTPSVTLLVDIPEKVEESFYKGKVSVCLKDAVFEPSSPNRHAIELEQLLLEQQRPLLFMYTDGGPDHRCTYLSVMLSCIYIWHSNDLDMLVLARTPPGNSWKNPAERIMSLLNLGLQSVGVMRTRAEDDQEALIKRCGSLKELRAKGSSDEDFKQAYTKTLEPPRVLINQVFQRLEWNGKRVQIEKPVTEDSLAAMLNHLQTYIDKTICAGDTMADLKRRPDLSKFLESHCQLRHYTFSVKKCGIPQCDVCFEPQLERDVFNGLRFIPDPVPGEDGDHYKCFEEVYGTPTTDDSRPGIKAKTTKKPSTLEPIPVGDPEVAASNSSVVVAVKTTAQNAKTVGRFILCGECAKPRVIYSTNKLSPRQLSKLDKSLEGLDYTCGAELFDFVDDEDLSNILLKVQVAVHQCADELEVSYYSSGLFETRCLYCGSSDEPLDVEEGVLPAHKACGPMKRRKYNLL